MSRRALLLSLLLVAGGCSGHRVVLAVQAPATWAQEPGGYEEAVVARIVDGDTIEVSITGRREGPGAGSARVGGRYDVRLLGIDTPESVKPNAPVECFSKEAAAALAAFIGGERVRLVKDVEDTDGFDRLLRYVYLGEEMANSRLVVNGYAFAYTYPPNVRHAELFVQLQREARDNGHGLWAPEACGGEV